MPRFKNITKEFLLENLVQNAKTGQWGVELDTVGIAVFHDCYFDPYLPEAIQDRVRACNTIPVVRQIHATLGVCDSHTVVGQAHLKGQREEIFRPFFIN